MKKKLWLCSMAVVILLVFGCEDSGDKKSKNGNDNENGEYEKTLESIVVDASSAKNEYNLYEQLDKNGIVVTAFFDDETSEKININNENLNFSYNFSKPGSAIVTVTYLGKSDFFNVTVIDDYEFSEMLLQQVLYGTANAQIRRTTAHLIPLTPDVDYEFTIQYKVSGGGSSDNIPIFVYVYGGPDWRNTNSNWNVNYDSNSKGRVENHWGCSMLILPRTDDEWVTEKYSFKPNNHTMNNQAGAHLFITMDPMSRGFHGWVNFVTIRKLDASGNPGVNVVTNNDFASGMDHWIRGDGSVQIITMEAPEIPSWVYVKPGEYGIAVYPSEHGNIMVKAGSNDFAVGNLSVPASELVTITAVSKPGFIFSRFFIEGASLNNGDGSTRTFNMPANNVRISAIFDEDTNDYPINIKQTNGGNVTAQAGTNAPASGIVMARAGTTITLKAIADNNHRFGRYTIEGALLVSGVTGPERTFIMPAGSVEVSASFPSTENDDNDPKSKNHIYIAFGQSNMEGGNGQSWDAENNHRLPANFDNRFRTLEGAEGAHHGRQQNQWYPARPPLVPGNGLTPVDYFGRYLVENIDEDINIGVIIIAIGGMSLDTWSPIRNVEDDAWVEWNAANGNFNEYWVRIRARYARDGNIYRRMVELGKLAQETGVIKGILVHQGEGGGGSAYGGWQKLLKFIYDSLLEDLELEPNSIPLLAGQPANGWFANGYNVMNINNDYPEFHAIPTIDLERPDTVHFSNSAQVILGTRYGEKMYELLYAGN